MSRLRAWLRADGREAWVKDVSERSVWTFLETFAALFGLQGLSAAASGHFPIGLAKGAAVSALAAALAVLKGAVVAKFKGGGLSPASSVTPTPPDGTDPGWSEPEQADPSMRPFGATPRSSEPTLTTSAPGVTLGSTLIGSVHVHERGEPARLVHNTSTAADVLKDLRGGTSAALPLPDPVPHGKLGKRKKQPDKRDLRMVRWIDRANLPRIKSSGGWDDAVLDGGHPYEMLLNDRIGDCVITTMLHMVQTWQANVGVRFVPDDRLALLGYEAVGGYNPADPGTDQGCFERDALNYWRRAGLAGHKIDGYGAIRPTDHDLVKIGISLFGAVMFGFNLPVSVQGKDHWSVGRGANAEPGSWGGHAVPAVAWDSRHLWVVTWPTPDAQVLPVSWSFVDHYADECWAVVSKDWLNSGAVSPSGFNEAQLDADLRAVGAA